jgi:16S rRNA (cytidine1402-2'-O)-methyltransferase
MISQSLPFFLSGHSMSAPPLEPGLYIVATPIGNLRDITLRALETLAACDQIACEDTRKTSILLKHYGIKKPLVSYHEHNADKALPTLLQALQEGRSIALVSDAGTPLISDPGFELVRHCVEAGLPVIPIPGACAAITALSASGLPTDRFVFAGFLPPKQGKREEALKELADTPATLIFYEGRSRLKEALKAMASTLGPDRPALVARELTKLFEEFRRGTLAELADLYDKEGNPKGEMVILVSGNIKRDAKELSFEELDAILQTALQDSKPSVAAALVARQTGLAKSELYQRIMTLKKKP